MENGRMMVVHSVILGILLYLFMFFILKHPAKIAEDRSILIAAIALIYMMFFGHGLPKF
jgi:hypothetical protein